MVALRSSIHFQSKSFLIAAVTSPFFAFNFGQSYFCICIVSNANFCLLGFLWPLKWFLRPCSWFAFFRSLRSRFCLWSSLQPFLCSCFLFWISQFFACCYISPLISSSFRIWTVVMKNRLSKTIHILFNNLFWRFQDWEFLLPVVVN